MVILFLEEEEQCFISITKDITSYQCAFYKYVTDMSQLVLTEISEDKCMCL